MAFQLKTFKQILEEGLSYVTGHSAITDINPGSVIRTVWEAVALEMAQIHVQMQSLLNLFSIDKASGTDLDERAQDFGLERERSTASAGVVTVGDSALSASDYVFSTLATALTTGSTQVQVQTADYADFPASGFVIIDRGNASREKLEYSSKTGPDLLNLVGNPGFSHSINAEVHLSTVGVDRNIVSGTQVKTVAGTEVIFRTTEAATLLDGDLSVDISIESRTTGASANVLATRIVSFVQAPFPTATVTNQEATSGGQDTETDQAFRARIKESQQALSSATATRIETAALSVVLETTGQRVFNAKIVEPINPGESDLYISDGTATYAATTQNQDEDDILVFDAEAGTLRSVLSNWPIVSDSEALYVTLEQGVADAVTATTITDGGKSWTANEWTGYIVFDANQKRYTVDSNTTDTLTVTPVNAGDEPVLGAIALLHPSFSTTYPTGSKLVKDTDYIINNTNGQLELTAASFPNGLSLHDVLLARYDSGGPTPAYTYYDGLLQEVQRVINGDPLDLDNYPGIKAAGSKVRILVPSVVSVSVDVSISAGADVDEGTLRPLVASAILDYINARDIGDDIRLARIIAAAMSVDGVEDVIVNTPSSNIVVTESQLAKTNSSLITVT